MAPPDGYQDGSRLEPPPPQYRPMREHEPADSSMRNLALAALAIAAVVMGGVWFMSGRHHAGVPVIEAETTPLRIKPANPGGMQFAGADDADPTDKSGVETDSLAPPPEAPAPQALAQQARAAKPAPASAPALAPAPVPAPAPAPAPAAAMPPVAETAPEAPLPVPRVADAAPSASPASKRAEVAPARATPAIAPEPVGRARPAPLSTTPGTTGTTGTPGGAQVQLAALDSEQAATALWAQLNRRMPELLAGHSPSVLRAEHDGKQFWRLRTGGFETIAAATQFCTQLRAHGAGCAIASF